MTRVFNDSVIAGDGTTEIREDTEKELLKDEMYESFVFNILKDFTLDVMRTIVKFDFYATYRMTRVEIFFRYSVPLPFFENDKTPKGVYVQQSNGLIKLTWYNNGFIDRY